MTTRPTPNWRSLMFVPVLAERFIAKAHTRGADALILDLEDSIIPSKKAEARAAIAAAVPRVAQNGADVVVRINRPLELAVPDIEAAVMPGVSALMLPKVMGPEHVRLLAELVTEREMQLGMEIGHTRFLVLIETVGVGQSETAVSDMVDMFIVLLLPAGGDDLQGIKRGVIELADLIVVNKADGDLKATARRSAADYQHALRMLRSPTPGWTPEVTTSSAQTGDGVLEIWDVVERFNKAVGEAGIQKRRAEQARAWMWTEVGETLLAQLKAHPDVRRLVGGLEREVEAGRLTPAAAARSMLQAFHGR